jgi:hypothetical protein
MERYKFKGRQLPICRPTTASSTLKRLRKTIEIWSKFEATPSGTAYKNFMCMALPLHQHDRALVSMFYVKILAVY